VHLEEPHLEQIALVPSLFPKDLPQRQRIRFHTDDTLIVGIVGS